MSAIARAHVEQMYQSAISRIEPEDVVASAVRMTEGQIIVGDRQYTIPAAGVYAIAIGKASVAMLNGLRMSLRGVLVDSIAVAKYLPEHPAPAGAVIVGSHPVPDDQSFQAGQSVTAFARSVPHSAVVFCLISGGGSALVEDLRDGVSLDELQRITSALLRGGATIRELNRVRSRLSILKGGGLLRVLRHTVVINLVVSDVLGDELEAIASGPTILARTEEPAERVLQRFGISANLPDARTFDQSEMVEPQTMIVANVGTAISAAADAAILLGYDPDVVSSSVEGEARDAGGWWADRAIAARADRSTESRPRCLIAGAEPTVTVRGDGLGGRNSEAALAAAIRLAGVDGVTLGFLATDGDDGVTGAAGAIVDGCTVASSDVDAARLALDNNDSYRFLAARGATFAPGPTGTNVNDLMIALTT